MPRTRCRTRLLLPAWWPSVLQRALAEARLDELEVGETGQAETPAERQPDHELCGKGSKEPPPPRRDRERGQHADGRLIEARRARVDHVEVAVRVGKPLHFGKYC
jgi:hypothetical protein